jgi:hypothetical protein
LHLHPDLVAAKILSKRKLNFTEKLKFYLFKLGVLNPAVSWSGLIACIPRLWWRSGIGKPSAPDPDSPLDVEVMISSQSFFPRLLSFRASFGPWATYDSGVTSTPV